VKFQRSAPFDADVRRLSADQLRQFRDVVRGRFAPAAVRHVEQPGAPWPRALRVRSVAGVPGVWEMTWSSSGPDGRATFEWIEIDGEPAIRWRRVGGHEIFSEP
jgi:hypothetical protein